MRSPLAACLLLAACDAAPAPCAAGFARAPDGNCYPEVRGPTGATTDGATGTGPTGPTDPEEDGSYDGPTYVEYGLARCTEDDSNVIVSVRTRGWAWRATVNLFGTGTATPSDEEHDLVSVEADPDGWWDEIEVGPLVAGTDPAFATRGLHTTFSCADVEDRLLTYAVRVYDLDGERLDCALWGHDEALVRSGGVTITQVTPPADFADCFLLEGPGG